MENNALARLGKATQMLAEAKTLDEVKHIMDIAEAARTYARAAKLGLAAYNHAAEVKVRAERKAGEFLKQLERNIGGDRKSIGQDVQLISEYKQVLDDNGVSYKTAHRWQEVAKMAEEVFEAHLEDMRGEKPITTSAAIKEVKTTERNEARSEMSEQAATIPASDRYNIHCADMRTWQGPREYDFIITDPPYPKEYLPLWSALADRALDWLKPDGLLIAMSGHLYLNDIYSMLDERLFYYWTACYLTPGQPTPLRTRQVNTTWKPLLIYSKSGKYNGKTFGDVFKSDGNDKDHHKWGQSISGMTSIISMICLPGQTILDPFCGAGSTGVSAVMHGCLFDGLDIEQENVNISISRISEALK